MARLVSQPSAKPTRKISAAAVGAFVGAVAVGSIRRWAPEFDAPGITEFIMSLCSGAVAVAFGWFFKERA